MRSDMMKMRILGIILAVAGLCVIVYGLFVRYDTLNIQQKIIDHFEKMSDHVHENSNGISNRTEMFCGGFDTTQDGDYSNRDTDNALLKIEGIDVIGVMEIPKIDLKVAVAEGTDKQTLKKAVGHFEGTAMPGEVGNFAVAGHRSYTYNEFFNRLDEMEIGDEIKVKTPRGNLYTK